MTQLSPPVSTYDDVAAEYYNSLRHPTCANFSELSNIYLTPRVRKYLSKFTAILEVGAGRSTVAPIMHRDGVALERLTLLDKSAGMLAYSREWSKYGLPAPLIADACRSELPSGNFGLIVSALGDPYNCPSFWQEVARLLEPGGICLFTTPAAEWSMRFREPHARAYAEFVVAGGYTVLVPSKVPPLDRQVRMIAEPGLQVVEVVSLSAEDLTGVRSPKLLVNEITKRLSIVRGFAAQRV